MIGGVLLAAASAQEARAQSWSVDLSAGRINYAAAISDLGTAQFMGTVRHEMAPWASLFAAAAAPVGPDDPFWTSGGTYGRWLARGPAGRRASIGVDFGAEGFLYRDRLVEQSGSGGSVDALPYVGLTAGLSRIEVRAGWRGQTLSQAGATARRGVIETGGRVMSDTAWPVDVDLRLVHADGTTYPFVGAAISAGQSTQLRLEAGKWMSSVLSDTMWGARLTVPLGANTALWTSARQDTPDPLYWNARRRSWSVGVTRRLGQSSRSTIAPPARAGLVEIRLPVSDAPDAAVSIAGDFNNGQPAPMRREGDHWVLRVQLAAGVYHYAFRSAGGAWFVPASASGRRDDGFGGHVAVLVVS